MFQILNLTDLELDPAQKAILKGRIDSTAPEPKPFTIKGLRHIGIVLDKDKLRWIFTAMNGERIRSTNLSERAYTAEQIQEIETVFQEISTLYNVATER